jgi:hypothetical protein
MAIQPFTASVSSFPPTEKEFLDNYGKDRIQRYGKTKSKLPKDLPVTKSTTPYIQPESYNADMGITRERFPVTHPEFKGYSPEIESALSKYSSVDRPLYDLDSREAGLSIPEKVSYTQPKPGLVNWESPSINGVSSNTVDPAQVQKGWNEFQISKLPDIKDVTPTTPQSFGTGIADNRVGKFIGNKAGILGEALQSPAAKLIGNGANIYSAASMADRAYRGSLTPQGATQAVAEREHPEGSRSDILSLMSGKPYDISKAHLPTYNEDPNSTGYISTSPTTQNMSPIQPPSISNGKYNPGSEASNGIPSVQNGVYNPQTVPDMKQVLSPTLDAIAQFKPDTSSVGKSTGVTGVQQYDTPGSSPLYSNQATNVGGSYNSDPAFQAMLAQQKKDRMSSLNEYGKVDRNSDFYKRNKQAMENLQ